jgi:hypothetical protein
VSLFFEPMRLPEKHQLGHFSAKTTSEPAPNVAPVILCDPTYK